MVPDTRFQRVFITLYIHVYEHNTCICVLQGSHLFDILAWTSSSAKIILKYLPPFDCGGEGQIRVSGVAFVIESSLSSLIL